MQRKFLAVLTIAILLFGAFGTAQAVVIVDTAPGPSTEGWTLNGTQWLAGEFLLSEGYTITSVEGFMWGSTDGTPTLTAVIYGDNYGVPGTQLYSGKFSTGYDSGGDGDWYGVSNQSWFLSSGVYWAAFEVRLGDTYDGACPWTATNPLPNEAFASTPNFNWNAIYGLNLGIRISGEPNNPVPEPSTILLLGFGLVGLAGVARKKMMK